MALAAVGLMAGCGGGSERPAREPMFDLAAQQGFDYPAEVRRVVAACVDNGLGDRRALNVLTAEGYEARFGGSAIPSYVKDWSTDRGLLSSRGRVSFRQESDDKCEISIVPDTGGRILGRLATAELLALGFKPVEIEAMLGEEVRLVRGNLRIEATLWREGPAYLTGTGLIIERKTDENDRTCRRDDVPASLKVGCTPGRQ